MRFALLVSYSFISLLITLLAYDVSIIVGTLATVLCTLMGLKVYQMTQPPR